MIEITATAESVEQAQALLDSGVDTLYIGEEEFGLRLPASFSRDEQRQLIEAAHRTGKQVAVAVNGIMHPDKMKKIPEYLHFLKEAGADQLVVGDPGVIFTLQNEAFDLPYIYDGETMVTSSRQINFWAKRGAVSAVLAREVPFEEMKEMAEHLLVPVEVLVYGATCIHQSKRPLLQNYYNYTQSAEGKSKERGLFLSEPKKEDTHYSIYEDSHGTHIFADNDISMMLELEHLYQHGYVKWKLDGIYAPGENFVQVARLFSEAKAHLLAGTWTEEVASTLQHKVRDLHPQHRGLDLGFFHMDPDAIR